MKGPVESVEAFISAHESAAATFIFHTTADVARTTHQSDRSSCNEACGNIGVDGDTQRSETARLLILPLDY